MATRPSGPCCRVLPRPDSRDRWSCRRSCVVRDSRVRVHLEVVQADPSGEVPPGTGERHRPAGKLLLKHLRDHLGQQAVGLPPQVPAVRTSPQPGRQQQEQHPFGGLSDRPHIDIDTVSVEE